MTTHPIIQTLTDKITAELTPVDREAAFDSMLDESYSFDAVGGPFTYMTPSSVLKEMDPIAYRCGVNDFADGMEWVEVDGQTFDQREVEELVADFVSELESELSDLESELEDIQSEDEIDQGDEDRVQQLIAEKRDELAAIAKDDFFS